MTREKKLLTIDRLQSLEKHYQKQPKALKRLQAVKLTLTALKQKQLPQKPLPQLLFSKRQLERDPALLPLDEAMSELRETLIQTYGIWFLPNQAFVADLKAYLNGRAVIELCAGNAVLSAALQELGVDAQPVDNLDWQGQDNERPKPWTAVTQADAFSTVTKAIAFKKQFPTGDLPLFLMAWSPNENELDWKILKVLRASGLSFDFVVIGEKNQATNSKRFWQQAELTKPIELNAHYQAFDAFQDAVYQAH
ncbi:SAM-dependent methyltransferase [Fructobacillus sp. M1-13]|uniref:SAM-dependent methyltransferase n=1 Tax=Fructobacillus papyriferae TaxID=2713171 RepID=A0ABS5QN56_9LACO|nr:SAM-dependent methyltransferase [Fructobacillus papyriferae]MBS9334519.1 SAM-dependent methyltransferase [Fructobacillus papyriferae]MCD2158508.1 SAM-dependent methyltransferase [Fructobacillus papyriferae]